MAKLYYVGSSMSTQEIMLVFFLEQTRGRPVNGAVVDRIGALRRFPHSGNVERGTRWSKTSGQGASHIPGSRSKSGRYNLVENPKFELPNPNLDRISKLDRSPRGAWATRFSNPSVSEEFLCARSALLLSPIPCPLPPDFCIIVSINGSAGEAKLQREEDPGSWQRSLSAAGGPVFPSS